MNGEPIQWSPGVSLEAIERQVIEKAWSFYKQNKTATAQALGIAIRTLENKLAKYAQDDQSQKAHYEQRKADRDAQLARSRGLAPAVVQVAVRPTTPAPKPVLPESPAGFRVEPAQDIPAQQPMPVPKPEEVQAVLPRQAAGSGQRGRR